MKRKRKDQLYPFGALRHWMLSGHFSSQCLSGTRSCHLRELAHFHFSYVPMSLCYLYPSDSPSVLTLRDQHRMLSGKDTLSAISFWEGDIYPRVKGFLWGGLLGATQGATVRSWWAVHPRLLLQDHLKKQRGWWSVEENARDHYSIALSRAMISRKILHNNWSKAVHKSDECSMCFQSLCQLLQCLESQC